SAASAQSASRSSHTPGKRRTPILGCGLVKASSGQLDLVALDQGVGEQLLAHALELGSCGVGIPGLQLEIDDSADSRRRYGKAELP
ncbi:MAG TPA: hypothetical protein VIU81_06605, partial [Gaiellaceae bacterium]